MNAVEIQGIDVVFQTDEKNSSALTQLTLQIALGQWVTILGHNGSGKSTLTRVLAGLCPVSRGHIKIMNQRVDKPCSALVQVVFQNPDAQIIGETPFEDVAFGLSLRHQPVQRMRETACELLTSFGLQLLMDVPVSTLSGGQKQLLCIASCLAMEPDVLIFDECTAMLDEGARQLVRQAVHRLHTNGKTILWVTQHVEEVADATEVVVLANGGLQFQGTPRQFFYDPLSASQPFSSCHALGFTPPYVVQVAEHLRAAQACSSTFQPLCVAEFWEGSHV